MRTGSITGFQIISRAIFDVAQNYQTALRISVPWMVPAAAFYLWGALMPSASMGLMKLGVVFWIAGLIAVMAYFLVSMTAIAIAWHRFVLMDEAPGGLFPISSDWQIGRYLLRVLGISIALAFILMPFVFAAYSLFGIEPDGSSDGGQNLLLVVPYLAVVTGLSYVFYRFCVVLPAIALVDRNSPEKGNHNPYTFAWAWRTSKPFAGQILLISLIAALISSAVQYIISFTMPQHPDLAGSWTFYAGLAAAAVINWCWYMFQLSLLTTLYGYLCMDQD